MKTRILIFATAISAIFAFSSCSPNQGSSTRQLEISLNQNKQSFFDSLHPIGTAKSIKLNSVTAEAPYVTIRMTVFWEGPITKDGYTKVIFRYDSEVERITGLEIEDTNGLTNEDIGYAAGSVLGAILRGD